MKKYLILFTLFLSGCLLAGCAAGGGKSRKPNQNFSRGLLLAEDATSSVEFSVGPSGDLIQVLIPFQSDEGGTGFRYLRINPEARIELKKELDLPIGRFFRTPRMVPSGKNLHLVWAAREDTAEVWQLRHLILDPDGMVIFGPQLLTEGARGVSQFEVVNDQSGGALVLWEDIASGGISFCRVSQAGEILQEPQVLVEEGEKPTIRRDPTGKYHLSWMVDLDLFYANFNLAEGLPLVGSKLTRIFVTPGNSMEDPVLGITPDHVFVFWSILRQTGLEAGTAITEYIVFPVGNPSEREERQLNVFPDPEGLSTPYQKGTFNFLELVIAPPEDYYNTDYVYSPQTLPMVNTGLAVAVIASQQVRLDSNIQIVTGIFDDGLYQGYSVATKSTQITRDPRINADQSGNLYLIWREGTSGGRVFYATTTPGGKATLDTVDLNDFKGLLLTGGLEALTGILLFPFAFPWMAVGLFIMIIWRLARNDEDISLPLSKVFLVISLIVYQTSKLLIFPDIILYVPFSAWIDVTPRISGVLQFGLPVLFFAVGFLTAEWRRRRVSSPPSTLSYYIIIVIVDTLLTLAVYGVVFMGEY
jgi:hypothetical protein